MDLFGNALNFIIWTGAYLSSRYAWPATVRFVVFTPLVALSLLNLFSLIAFDVTPSASRLNIGLNVATLIVILLFLFESGRRKASDNR